MIALVLDGSALHYDDAPVATGQTRGRHILRHRRREKSGNRVPLIRTGVIIIIIIIITYAI